MLSRKYNLFQDYKERFEEFGFYRVTVSGVEKDALDMLIDDMKPSLVIIGGSFYQSAVVYMTGLLLKRHKGINIAIISTDLFPAAKGMKCICNGVKSCLIYPDGREQFYHGIALLAEGKPFISPSVVEFLEGMDEMPKPFKEITEKEHEVLRCVRNGFTGRETAQELGMCLDTVNAHKKEMYKKFGVRNENELIGAGRRAGLINDDEPDYYPRDYELGPKIRKRKEERTGKREERSNIRSFYGFKNKGRRVQNG